MRFTLWFCSVLAGAYFFAGQQQAPTDPCSLMRNDPYSVGIVRYAFRVANSPVAYPEDQMQLFPVSANTLGINQVGDGVSVATLKIFGLKELTDKETATAYLSVVRWAFSAPKKILLAADSEPKVTLSLLDFLKDKETADVVLENSIESTKEFILRQTSTKGSATVP